MMLPQNEIALLMRKHTGPFCSTDNLT